MNEPSCSNQRYPPVCDRATWTAADALENGVVAKVVDDEEVDIQGLALAHQYAEGPAQVVGLAKTIMLKSFESSLDEMMNYENLAQVLAQSSAEFREGLAALKEKRPARFAEAALFNGGHDGMSSYDEPKP